MSILFGTAGQSVSFAQQGFRTSAQAPAYTRAMGLDAFEYQCGRGVRIKDETAAAIAAEAARHGIAYSLHAPYYISMSSMEEEKRLNSVEYILQSARAVRALGGRRVVFHAGSCGKQTRAAALEKALDTLRRMQQALDEAGYTEIVLCPETMGKINQLGTVDEVLALCSVDKRITPCIDFGHVNAREQGMLSDKAGYAALLDSMERALDDDRAVYFHAHFSKIEYTQGGEKRHRTFADAAFGPPFEPLLELLYQRSLQPVLICESAGTQAEDAATMKRYYNALAGEPPKKQMFE